MGSSQERFEVCKPYFQLFTSAEPKEIKNLLRSLGKNSEKKKILICCFSDLTLNYFILGKSTQIFESEKKYLRHFSKMLISLAKKYNSNGYKLELLVKNPGVVKILSRLALNEPEIWSNNLPTIAKQKKQDVEWDFESAVPRLPFNPGMLAVLHRIANSLEKQNHIAQQQNDYLKSMYFSPS